MRKLTRWGITVTSPLNEISTDQQGNNSNKVGVSGDGGGVFYSRAEPEFVNLLRSPGIDTLFDVPVCQAT